MRKEKRFFRQKIGDSQRRSTKTNTILSAKSKAMTDVLQRRDAIEPREKGEKGKCLSNFFPRRNQQDVKKRVAPVSGSELREKVACPHMR